MFEQTFVEGKTKKTWTVLIAFIAQTVFIIVAVILPMIYFDVLPKTTFTSFLVAPPPPPPPPPPPAAVAVVKIVKVIPRQFDAGRLMAPKSVPKEIATIREEELPPASTGVGGVMGGIPGGVAGGTPGGVLGSILSSTPTNMPPPPPPPVKAVTLKRITIGGNVQQAKLVRQPKPVYPPLAKQARISGVVHLAAVISKDGTIQDLKVISGSPSWSALPLLRPIPAIRCWRWTEAVPAAT